MLSIYNRTNYIKVIETYMVIIVLGIMFDNDEGLID